MIDANIFSKTSIFNIYDANKSKETPTSNNCGQECPSRKPSSRMEQLTRKGIVLVDFELAYQTCTQID